MAKQDFLLEIGLEEMPARFVDGTAEQLAEATGAWLTEQRLSYTEIRTYATPRRLAVLVSGLAEKQEDRKQEAKGPAKKIAIDEDGEWSKAALGFAKSRGVSPDELYLQTFKGNDYVYALIRETGKQAVDILPDIHTVIERLSFPKNMRWGSHSFSFIRPIRWLVALYGERVIPLMLAGISAGRETTGHRVLGQKVTLDSPGQYVQALREQYVLVDVEERRESIREQLTTLEKERDWSIDVDLALLQEVTHLVEYPTALYGSFDEEYLALPEEVLTTTMKEHQRYFPVRYADGRLAPYFVTVRNGLSDSEGIVARGNEKVLRARLADARFFFEEDQKLSIDDALSQLENVVFHEELGTMGDKVRRVKQTALLIAERVGLSAHQVHSLERAAAICKFDLVTHMVDEFSELQGKMGEIYALKAGEDEEVAKAVFEHYLPRFASDSLPQSEIGAVLSVADKLDSIISSFSIGLVPTGSQDPYALRRQAAGIIHIVVDKGWQVDIYDIFSAVLDILSSRQQMKRTTEQIRSDLVDFFRLRLKNGLLEQSVRHDVLDAVLNTFRGDVLSVYGRAYVLMEKVEQPTFKPLVEALTRVRNLAEKLAQHTAAINSDYFEHDAENMLHQETEKVAADFSTAVQERRWQDAYSALLRLQQPIEHYFDHVMVMAEDEHIRRNRLSQLQAISSLTERFADFSAIVFASKKNF